MIAARPLLFKAPMVQALLDGRKTQTRRLLKPQPEVTEDDRIIWGARGECALDCFASAVADDCPHGVRGDYIWVKETHALVGNVDPGWLLYRASGYENECRRHRFDNPPPETAIKWKPSIFMKRWMSRLTLRLTDVRVEQLQDISDGDCTACACSTQIISRACRCHLLIPATSPETSVSTKHGAVPMCPRANGHAHW